ncbi:MAG TPA: N-acetyl-gamma-glutamyl-phosphate reductase [Bacillota bacterium]
MIKVGIIGASGYTGGELIRLLSAHPEVELAAITSRTHKGKKLEAVFPALAGWDGPVFSGTDTPEAVAGCDLVFLAVPHGVAMELAPPLLANNQKVIDLGADFRFRDPRVFEAWYQHPHSQPELTREKAVYGLPELYRDRIKKAQIVGNPGCYPTSIILGCYPFIKAGMIDLTQIIIDSKSGVSGAGRKADLAYNFAELAGNFKAYGLPNHRHTPEIEQELSLLAGQPVLVSFTPHLLPVARGILTTLHLKLTQPLTTAEAEQLVAEVYQDEPFVKLVPAPALPELKGVVGTNCCRIGVRVDSRTGQLIVISVIDNMVKGAAGQAVQNLNLMFGLGETTGLLQWPIFP